MSTQIADGVFKISPGKVHAFLIEASGLTIVDAGMPGQVDVFLKEIFALGKQPTDVTDILITHYHADHTGSLTALVQATGAKVHVPVGDADLIRNGGPIPPLRRRGLQGWAMSRFVNLSHQPPHPVDNEISGGQTLDIAGGIETIATPGHTAGHLCFIHRPTRTLFTGDAAANLVRLGNLGIEEDLEGAAASFAALGGYDFDKAAFAHGRPILRDASERFRRVAQKL